MLRFTYRFLGGLVPMVLAAGPAAGDAGSPPAASGRTVLLELFTSQGCSSCPPADRLLARLGREGTIDGVAVVPLAYHVDYWNYIGWTDPFSAPRWSARQRRYAAARDQGRVYTPQLVLNGAADLVGSDERRVRAGIPAAGRAGAPARIALSHLALSRDGTEVEVQVEAGVDGAEAGRLLAMVALFENGLVTAVAAGENAHRTLENQYVVRVLQPAFSLTPGERGAQRKRFGIDLDPGWVPANLGVAAFLQNPDSLEVHAATARGLPAARPPAGMR